MDRQDGQDWIDCWKRTALWTAPPAERRACVAGIPIHPAHPCERQVGTREMLL